MTAPWLDDGDVCACGCGMVAGYDARGRKRRYAALSHVLRHNHYVAGEARSKPGVQTSLLNPFFGRTHTPETRAVLSEKASVPKPWLRGDRNGMAGRTGSSNPNWRGGGSPERQRLYATSEGREFMRSVRRRDEFRCVECGSTRQLHVHHLRGWAEYPAGRLDPDNAVTLCRGCHIREHTKGGERHQ